MLIRAYCDLCRIRTVSPILTRSLRRRHLPRRVLVPRDPPRPQRDDPALQLPLPVLAAGIEAPRPSEPEPPRGLVDVPVQPRRGLVALDRLAHRRASAADEVEPPTA